MGKYTELMGIRCAAAAAAWPRASIREALVELLAERDAALAERDAALASAARLEAEVKRLEEVMGRGRAFLK